MIWYKSENATSICLWDPQPKLKRAKEHKTHKLPLNTCTRAKIQPPPPIYRPSKKDRSAPTLGVTTQALTGAFWSTHEVLHRTVVHPLGLCVLPTQAPRLCRVSPASKLLSARILSPPAEPPVLVLWLNQVTLTVFCEPPQIPRTRCSLHANPTHDLATMSSRLSIGFVE
jgi:hypothetical protein